MNIPEKPIANAYIMTNDRQNINSEQNLMGPGKRIIVLIITHHCRPSGIYINGENKASNLTTCNEEMSLFYEKHTQLIASYILYKFEIFVLSIVTLCLQKTLISFLDIHNYQGDNILWVSEWRGIGTGQITFTGLREGEFYCSHGRKDHLLTMIHPS